MPTWFKLLSGPLALSGLLMLLLLLLPPLSLLEDAHSTVFPLSLLSLLFFVTGTISVSQES